ncbi:MAG: hypothetical protein MZW92_10960 [Comamonadaceae bacterium]|nr:hypothetical protein [Comamonadaceae bacterium]
MSIAKRVLNPQRLRQVPEHFSWIDHRLVREHTIEKADVVRLGALPVSGHRRRRPRPELLRRGQPVPAPRTGSAASGQGARRSHRARPDRLRAAALSGSGVCRRAAVPVATRLEQLARHSRAASMIDYATWCAIRDGADEAPQRRSDWPAR